MGEDVVGAQSRRVFCTLLLEEKNDDEEEEEEDKGCADEAPPITALDAPPTSPTEGSLPDLECSTRYSLTLSGQQNDA